MKHLDEFRDPRLARRLLAEIRSAVNQPWVIMEICGGQTHAIMRHGIDQLLPAEITLVHGPGCPVCVTPLETIDQLLPQLHQREDHMAIVVDEFGSAVGIITMEDIVEEVVGEIDVGYQLQLMSAHAQGEEKLRKTLSEHGLEWEDVEALALRVAAVHSWVERHLRPRITVTVRDVEQAYQRVIVEPMRKAGTEPPSLAHVNEDLRRLVSEEKLNAEIERWLDQCRERHRVTRFVE